MNTLNQLIRDGKIYRKKTCCRCGAEKYEKLLEAGESWEDDDVFEVSGFGTVVIVPYEMPYMDRRELPLCVNCGVELDDYLKAFCHLGKEGASEDAKPQ